MSGINFDLTSMQSTLSWVSSGWYAKRHFEETMKPQTTCLGKIYHVVMGIIDLFPIIGRVASFAEKEFTERLDRAEKSDSKRIEECKPLERIELPVIKPQRLSVCFQNGVIINLEKGKFNGDVSKAMIYLQDFCSQAIAKSNSYGWGYGELIINGQKHSLTPYGIDIDMMLSFCGGKAAENFPLSHEPF